MTGRGRISLVSGVEGYKPRLYVVFKKRKALEQSGAFS